ncbi:unnamed protein product, partial [Amoebophrya sp. A120]
QFDAARGGRPRVVARQFPPGGDVRRAAEDLHSGRRDPTFVRLRWQPCGTTAFAPGTVFWPRVGVLAGGTG